MLVPGLGPHRVVAELLPVQMELASDEVHDRRGNELARGQQAARVAEHAQQVLVAQGVVAQQVRLALRKGNRADLCRRVRTVLRAILFHLTYAKR